jgi:uncharacterized protein YyaL (SSP411 family)
MNETIASQAAASGSALIQACRNRMFAPQKRAPLQKNLQAAYQWLCRAQDVTGDGGVAAWYHLFRGWATSYPETTGYIIPTFLAYSQLFDEPEAKTRALRMADFECRVQLPSGAVRGGQMNTKPAPAVFNTGQVLFGWVAAFQATGNSQYADAAARAAEWLRRGQDHDGAWRKELSPLTSSRVQTYNVRTAWGLALAGHVLDEPRWIEAARKNCDWAVSQQQQNGWFAHDTFGDNESPLVHTIGYTLEGLLGVGQLLGVEQYVEASERGVAPLVEMFNESQTLKGRYDRAWRATVGWRCPTGEAQIAVVLSRLSHYKGISSLAETGHCLVEGLSAIQNTRTSRSATYGAIPGSMPLWGTYSPFKFVNWAAKFYMDALMLDLFRCDVQKRPMQRSPGEFVQ